MASKKKIDSDYEPTSLTAQIIASYFLTNILEVKGWRSGTRLEAAENMGQNVALLNIL